MFHLSGRPTLVGRLRRTGIAAAVAAATAVTLVAPAIPAHATATATGGRIFGATRFETAAAIAAAKFPGGTPNAIISSGRNYPDALAGSFLGGAAPASAELLTEPDSLNTTTANALSSLKVKKAFILGQTQAVSANVESQLDAQLGAANVVRIGGATRYDTMQMIDEAPASGAPAPVGTPPVKTAIVASGANYPDALAAGPASYKKNIPIVLTDPNSFSPQAQKTLNDLGIKQVLIMGGTAAVSAAVESAINANGQTTLKRFDGTNRYDTAAKFATYEVANLGATNNPLYLASGENYPDALTGAQLAGDFSPVLLTPANGSDTATDGYCQSNAATITGSVITFGGPAAVSNVGPDSCLKNAGSTNTTPPTSCTTNCTNPNPTPAGSHPSTTAPDLISASIITNSFGTSSPSTIKFTFDKQITAVPVTTGLHLLGFAATNVATPTAGSCFVDSDGVSADCSIATAANPTSYTLAVADSGSVTGSGGGNPLGQVPFGGNTTGSSSGTGGFPGPILTSAAQVGGSSTQIAFVFNQTLSAAGAGTCGYDDANGNEFVGGAPVISGNQATFTFATINGPVRYICNDDAVKSSAASGTLSNAAGGVGAAIGPPSNRPNLVSIARTSTPNQFVFTVDHPATAVTANAAGFELYANQVTPAVPKSTGTAVSTTDNLHFIVTMGGGTAITTSNANLFTYGAILDDVAPPTALSNAPTTAPLNSQGSTTLANTVGAAAVGTGSGPAASSFIGPVLQSAAGTVATKQVAFTFDRPIAAGSPDCTKFFVISPGGTATPGSAAAAVSVSGNVVTCPFTAGGVPGMVGAGNIGSTAGTQAGVNGGALGVAATDAQAPANPAAPADVSASAT